jgi:hypothetical protein
MPHFYANDPFTCTQVSSTTCHLPRSLQRFPPTAKTISNMSRGPFPTFASDVDLLVFQLLRRINEISRISRFEEPRYARARIRNYMQPWRGSGGFNLGQGLSRRLQVRQSLVDFDIVPCFSLAFAYITTRKRITNQEIVPAFL